MDLSRYKHVAFDLDGTLVRTVPEYRHVLVPKVVQELGGIVVAPHFIDRFWFEPGRDALILSAFCVDPEKFWALFRKTDTPEERSKHRGVRRRGAVDSKVEGKRKTYLDNYRRAALDSADGDWEIKRSAV